MSDTTPRGGEPVARPRSSVAVAVAVGAVVVVALTIAVVIEPGPLPGELGWVRTLQRLGTPVPELAEFVRTTTGTEGAVIVAVVPAAWAVVRHGRRGVVAVFVVAAAMLVVQPAMKEVVDRPRPDATQVEVRAGHSSTSFPSGHSLGTTAVWGSLAGVAIARRRRTLAVIATVPIAVNLFAGAVQGVHWPSDSVAGTLIGAGAALVAVRLVAVRLVADGHPGATPDRSSG